MSILPKTHFLFLKIGFFSVLMVALAGFLESKLKLFGIFMILFYPISLFSWLLGIPFGIWFIGNALIKKARAYFMIGFLYILLSIASFAVLAKLGLLNGGRILNNTIML